MILLIAPPGWGQSSTQSSRPSSRQSSKRKEARSGPEFRNPAPGVRYVGSNMCKSCHLAFLAFRSPVGVEQPRSVCALGDRTKSSKRRDLSKAIACASQVIAQGSTSAYDYWLLDGLLAQSGNLAASIDLLKKGISSAHNDRLFYERLAVRQPSAGNTAEGLVTFQHGLEVFPEDSVLRDMPEQATARGLVH